ncbi:hypothetical protein [Emticicia sp. TH156]|uniref:hypothetical protein n=1 Tax=Emticicia sp. TH156 TaxID=2067454 RepID=UPI000C7634EE|nr:hypothetical protein [Emticicia sp. TH156]PLK44097.1 hypothetical protein C0V77_13195 [Emticicia sp. TH156]
MASFGFVTQKEIDYLVSGFLAKTLPSADWTHQAHLITGLWHVAGIGYEKALAEMRAHIPVYNEAGGGMNTDSGGYHDTITVFWVWLLNEYWIRYSEGGRSFEDICNTFLQSKYADRNNALIFYSRERLFSKEARLGYAAPDIQPLDFTKI